MSKLFEPCVPESLVALFAIEKKSDLEKYCADLVIRSSELVRLITFCSLIGYLHGRAHEDFEPEQAELTTADIDVLRRQQLDKLPKFAAKVRNLFSVRKRLSAHLFYNGTRWHLFYFTFGDMEHPGHWKHGSHVHFVNDLWPEYRPEQLEDLLFSERRTKIGGIHIRYINSTIIGKSTAWQSDAAEDSSLRNKEDRR